MSSRELKRNRWLAASAGAVAFALVAWWFLTPDPLEVEVATATRGPMRVTVDQQGEVRVHDRYVVSAPVAARVLRSELRDGDAVAAGQPVATLEPLPLDPRQRQEALARLDTARAYVAEARQEVTRAQAEAERAQRDLERAERLVAERFVSPEALDAARTNSRTASARLAAARAREQAASGEVRAAEAALLALDPARANRLIQLAAPVSGRVLRVLQQSAASVTAGTPILIIGDPSRFEIVADVLSTDAVRIPQGAEVSIEEWGGEKPLRARVRLVEPYAFTKVSALGIEEKRVNVVIDPVDPLGPLGDGYRVEARIVVWSADDVVKVPSSAVFRTLEGWQVFAVEGGRAVRRTLEVGQRNPDEVEVVSGLPVGAQVVRYPSSELVSGARVKARSTIR